MKTGNPVLLAEPAANKLMQSVKDRQPVETMPYASMVEGYTPVSQAVEKTAREKQPVGLAEEDLLHAAGAVKNVMGDTYTRDNFTHTMNAAAYGEGFGHQDDMENPDPDTLKGFRNTWNEGMLSLGSVRQMGNRLFDPEGKYLPTKAFGQWIKDEENRLESNTAPELADFMKLNWKENPDEVIRLGGKYFRESLLGTHLFGFAIDAMKGRAGPVANQIVGAVTGIARFYNMTDDIMASLSRGTAASSAENWDFIVGQLTRKLPQSSRMALSFMNSVLTKDMKAKMFNNMIEQYRTQRTEGDADTR